MSTADKMDKGEGIVMKKTEAKIMTKSTTKIKTKTKTKAKMKSDEGRKHLSPLGAGGTPGRNNDAPRVKCHGMVLK